MRYVIARPPGMVQRELRARCDTMALPRVLTVHPHGVQPVLLELSAG